MPLKEDLIRALEVLGYEAFTKNYDRLLALRIFDHALKNNEYDVNSLKVKYGLTETQIKFLHELFPQLKYHKKPSSAELNKALTNIKNELQNASKELLKSIELWIFPHWRKIIGAKYPGMFEGRPIKEVKWAAVAILVPSEREIVLFRMRSGEEVIGIFGLGSYITEFLPEKAIKPIYYFLPIHGVILERSVYEATLNSKKLVVAPKYSDFLREDVLRIPLEILAGSKLSIRFFAPTLRKHSTILELFLEAIKKFQRKITMDDVAILSAWKGAFNKVLVSRNAFSNLAPIMLRGLPGIVGYEGILDKLEELIVVHNTEVFEHKIQLLWLRFAIAGINLIEQFLA